MNNRSLVFFVILLISFLFCEQLTSYQVDLVSCQKAVERKLIELGKEKEFSIKQEREIQNDDGKVIFYAFILEPAGYVILTNQTDLPPVLAYSFLDNFEQMGKDNLLIEIMQADLKLRLDNIPDLPDYIVQNRNLSWEKYLNENSYLDNDRPFEQWPPEGTTPTGGWLEENWHQNSPYNDLCPMQPFTSDRAVAGCPAVAMAQILNFHRTTNGIQFDDNDDYYHNYDGNQYMIDDDHTYWGFPSFPELNAYLDSLSMRYEQVVPPTNNDKAALVFACGVAAQQVYTPSVSGTFGVDQAFMAYQRFAFEETELLDEDDLNLYERISDNIIEALPVHLAVVNPDWTMGHNVVIDGYNTDEFYHLNFGWGGSYNGWYLLPDEVPYSLTVVEGAVVDINLSEVGTVEPAVVSLTPAELSNYPNPFKNLTTLSFTLTTESTEDTEISIYNIRGQLMKKMSEVRYQRAEDRDQRSGNRIEGSVVWDGTDMKGNPAANGIYFWKLKTGRTVSYEKMIRMK